MDLKMALLKSDGRAERVVATRLEGVEMTLRYAIQILARALTTRDPVMNSHYFQPGSFSLQVSHTIVRSSAIRLRVINPFFTMFAHPMISQSPMIPAPG